MKTIVVGGNFGDIPKKSKIISELAQMLSSDVINGGTIEQLTSINLKGYNLIIWAPNISNDIDKVYPKKDTGSVLICTKVMRENTTREDSVGRIFKMGGNAVIEISDDIYDGAGLKRFTLIDALNNIRCSTTKLMLLKEGIFKFYEWTNSSIRISAFKSIQKEIKMEPKEYLDEFVELTKEVADKIEVKNKERYFGNMSTRCDALFPSCRKQAIYVSPRNIDKRRIETTDLIPAWLDLPFTVWYMGERKPSVDTPVQLFLYNWYKNINYIIHGHAFIKGSTFTRNYFPCGDCREFMEVITTLNNRSISYGSVNLSSHGFLILASSLHELEQLVEQSEFVSRR